MRGYQIEKNIKFEELEARLKDCPEPKAGEDEVIVDVYCAGLNFFDLLQIEVSTLLSTEPEMREVDDNCPRFAGEISTQTSFPLCRWYVTLVGSGIAGDG